jgi:YQGE family putative transporter
LASLLAQTGKFINPDREPFIFFNFHRLWKKMIGMAILKGIAQVYIITAPVMLVMKLVGSEGALGIIQSTGAFLSAILLYILGRKTNAGDRLKIFIAGLSLFLFGSIVNATMHSAEGVIFFLFCLAFSRPLLDLAYSPILLDVIEFVSLKEKRNKFAYIFNHELGICIGRLFGCSIFLMFSTYVNEDWVLKYILLVIAMVYFISLGVAHSIVHDVSWNPAKKNSIIQDIEIVKKSI